MKKNILHIFELFSLLLVLCLWTGCSSEDDVEGIFVGKTWCVNYMFKSDGKTAAFTDEEKETIIVKITVSYSGRKTSMPNRAISLLEENGV